MDNRIEKKFKALKAQGKKAFIAYITAGDPSLSVTAKLVPELEKSGVDIIELGIPFSDPVADGPTIQAASQRALKGKVNLAAIFKMVKALRSTTSIPIVFMTYYNPVFKYGLSRFAKDCRLAGVDGVIVPDLPYEEAQDLLRLARSSRVAVIFLAAPTSTPERLRKIASLSSGFIYYVSLTGVTGARKSLPIEIRSKVKRIKSMTKLPVCVGFGISDPSQAKKVASISDGVIVGSAIVKVIKDNAKSVSGIVSKASRFTKALARAVHNA
ncbi:MAG: tryptophan synthase subunit alpha [Candidatus Omnitrophota bacterium]|jgi:tryptophan synthase alpha chain